MTTANFPAIGPIGSVSLNDFVNGQLGAQINSDLAVAIGGNVGYAILAELRVHSILLFQLANLENTDLGRLRADAIADMNLSGLTYPVTGVASS